MVQLVGATAAVVIHTAGIELELVAGSIDRHTVGMKYKNHFLAVSIIAHS